MNKQLPLPTPGEILATEFLEPMGLTQYRLAKAIHVPQTRIAAIIKDGRSITADTALRLARFFGTSTEFWMNLQSQYDTDTARLAIGMELESIEPFATA
ncbi:MAG: HigA family addiction module antitoxin [Comamonadaceae bacterium]|nr:HigA family addiction module antidote protein [Burkholderiales bacterium]MEB2349159.1 HigA family addiction module antitoxin [Comamonadaceae bacterium]